MDNQEEKKPLGKIEVSEQLIRECLAIPEGTKIYNIVPHKYIPGVFVFYVESPDLPKVPVDKEPPILSPILTADNSKRPDTWINFDWNIKE